jgi:hypothetical protein
MCSACFVRVSMPASLRHTGCFFRGSSLLYWEHLDRVCFSSQHDAPGLRALPSPHVGRHLWNWWGISECVCVSMHSQQCERLCNVSNARSGLTMVVFASSCLTDCVFISCNNLTICMFVLILNTASMFVLCPSSCYKIWSPLSWEHLFESIGYPTV